MIVLATHNAHKVDEVREILSPYLAPQAICAAQSTDPEPVENATSFAGNALIKARATALATGMPALADDSGLCVDVMGGAPGIFSARWCGQHGDDRANCELLLAQLADIPDAHRSAHFTCAAALVLPTGEEWVEEGFMYGTVRHRPAGTGGFGYDPIFEPTGCLHTAAELSAEEKNALSHRRHAFHALAPRIQAVIEKIRNE